MSTSASTSLVNKCKRCRNTVQTGLRCIVCGVTSHKSCLNALKTVKFLDETSVNCCTADVAPNQDSNIPTVNETKVASSCDEIKIKYLEELIRQKDIIIATQSVAIESLRDQVSYLKREPSVQNKTVEDGSIQIQSSSNFASVTANTKKRKPSNGSKLAPSHVTTSAVSHAVHLAQTSAACKNLIHLNDDIQDDAKSVVPNHQHPSKDLRRSRNILTGDANCPPINFPSLKAAKMSNLKHFHTTNWDPDADEQSLVQFLRELVPEAQVTRLDSRNPTVYSSFKVSVPNDKAHIITKSGIWPPGIRVNQFFLSRKSTSQPCGTQQNSS